MSFILFYADVLLTNMRCNKLINMNFYNMALFVSRFVFRCVWSDRKQQLIPTFQQTK